VGRPSARRPAGPPQRTGSTGVGRTGEGVENRRRVAIVGRLVAGLVSVLLLTGAGYGWQLNRVAEASVTRIDAVPSTGNDQVVTTGAAMNLLLVGSDSRADLTEAQLAELNAGEDSGMNTDTMILVHVPADGSKAAFVSFPRDSYVDIPGHGKDKLNAAYSLGHQSAPSGASDAEKQGAGAQLLMSTISQLTGLQIDHYAEVDLLGFFNLTSIVGGVDVNICEPTQDDFSGADFQAGPQTISGVQALQFVRQRHGLPRGDLDRIVRQQVFIGGVLRKMLSEEVLFDLGKQQDLVQAAAESLTLDKNLKLLDLARQMQSVTAGNIQFQTLPIVGDAKLGDGTSIIQVQDQETLHDFFAELSADPASGTVAPPAAPQTVAPGEVGVQVFNGSGTPGVAASAGTALTAQGFSVAGTGNADRSTYTVSEIRYAAGDEGLAATLAAAVPGARTVESAEATAGTVELVIGSDFNGIGKPVTAQPAAPAAAADTPRTAADTTCVN
jgi:LCP family protein required for cell wall assembly